MRDKAEFHSPSSTASSKTVRPSRGGILSFLCSCRERNGDRSPKAAVSRNVFPSRKESTRPTLAAQGFNWVKKSLLGSEVEKPLPPKRRESFMPTITEEPSVTLSEDSGVHTATASTSDPATSSTIYFSARIERMMRRRSDIPNRFEFEIESSRDHWSELDPTWDTMQAPATNLEALKKLQKDPQWNQFLRRFTDLVLGEKFAEGGQAEIFEAEATSADDGETFQMVVKAFKKPVPLRSLQVLLPPRMLNGIPPEGGNGNLGSCLIGATVLEDDRFAFILKKCWGDLRKLIDIRMQHRSNQGAPFAQHFALRIMHNIAGAMKSLHKNGIIHRDLKASNVLIRGRENSIFDPKQDYFVVSVADFECSVEVLGTGFWRAPEILLQLRNGNSRPDFTPQADVYSYAMTCYEVLTGQTPYEDHPRSDYEFVLSGHRPSLPNDVVPELKTLIERCWHPEHTERPDFETVVEELELMSSRFLGSRLIGT